jgi:hypothetical protein
LEISCWNNRLSEEIRATNRFLQLPLGITVRNKVHSGKTLVGNIITNSIFQGILGEPLFIEN